MWALTCVRWQSPLMPNQGYKMHDESDQTQLAQSLIVSPLPCVQWHCPGEEVNSLRLVIAHIAFY